MIVGLFMFPDSASEARLERGLVSWRLVAARGIGTYLNFQGSANASDLTTVYPTDTYQRLARIKRIYDPDNRFALNHNIEPARRNRPGVDHHRLR